MAMTPMANEMRAPKSNRVNTSRPFGSVPRRCFSDGPCSGADYNPRRIVWGNARGKERREDDDNQVDCRYEARSDSARSGAKHRADFGFISASGVRTGRIDSFMLATPIVDTLLYPLPSLTRGSINR